MFNIENLLGLSKNNNNNNNNNNSECFMKEIESERYKNERFQTTRAQKTFVFENLEKCEDPVEVLRDCFRKAIDEAVKNAKKDGLEPDYVGASLSSKLLTPNIYHPIRPIDTGIADTLINLFQKVSQSKEEGSLYGEPFTLTITTVKKKDLPMERKIKGKGQFTKARCKIPETSLIRIDNPEGRFCLFFALEVMRVYCSKESVRKDFYRFRNNYTKVGKAVHDTMKAAKIPMDLPEYDVQVWGNVIQNYYNTKYGVGVYKIFVFNSISKKPIYKSSAESYKHAILLYHNNEHFDGIRTIASFFGAHNYCLDCESSYGCKKRHSISCKSRCKNCGGCGVDYPCKDVGYGKKCLGCNKLFQNEDCFEKHQRNNFCKQSKKCEKCGTIYRVDRGHECGKPYCNVCEENHPVNEYCHIKPYVPKNSVPYRLVAFDFEAMQIKKENSEKLEHKINFACAKVLCTFCIKQNTWNQPLDKECKICGPHRTLTWAPFNYKETKVDKHSVTEDVLSSFVNWLSTGFNPKYKTLVYSHYGGRYDCTFIFGEFVQNGVVPKIIRQGNRLYEMKIPKGKDSSELIFRDSFNFVSQKLDSLVDAFALPIKAKLHFPHMYNLPENYNKTLPHLPDIEYYLPKSKKPEEKEKLEKWYKENYTTEFNLNEKLAEYCENDVNILAHALVALRKTFFDISKREGKHNGIDILHDSMTIASACMKHYRLNHLKPKHLGIVPERGYDRQQNQSMVALKFLAWYEHYHKVDIQTVLSDEGEKRIGEYPLDGYIPSLNKGIQFNGCFYHGCQSCWPDDESVLADGKTARELRIKELSRQEFLKKHVDLEVYWECQINKLLPICKPMNDFFNDCFDKGHIKERDCYFGGRTGPMKIFETIEDKPGYKISYKDFTSLYPFTNYSTSYPVGHPKVKKFKHAEQKIEWRHSSNNPYKGLLKVLITPPKSLKVPVLPVRFDERLLFTLCRKCSIEYPEGARMDEYKCCHTDEERSFVSTCTHIELNAALDAGYVATRLFRVVEYAEWDDALFKGYVQEFYKIKLEASGFPKELDTEEKIDAFIKESKERFGIDIDKENVKRNDAMRTLAKICLNSLWGRFSLRNTLAITELYNDPSQLDAILNAKTIDVTDFDQIAPDMFMVTYKTKKEFIKEHSCSNVIISLWTTSAARLYLLRALQTVAATPGCTILYMDTDSVIYSHPENIDPLPTGPHIGDLTDEFAGKTIIEFVSAGCKNYAIKYYDNKNPNKILYKLKVRGFSLDYNACQLLHYDTFKQKTLDFKIDVDPIIISYPHFLRPDLKSGKVFTSQLMKKYRPFISKGIVVNQEVVAFGTG